MRALLDTHTFLWYYFGDPKLSTTARTAIETPGAVGLISPAVYWEVAIKIGTKKLVLSQSYLDLFQTGLVANGFSILPVEPRHTAELIGLPYHHRDPFDRLLVAQAIAEQVPVVSADAALDRYPIRRIW